MNRRSVLRHSVKLAYATPLVAASLSLHDAADAAHTVSTACSDLEPCGPCERCVDGLGCAQIDGCVAE
jgi:hypothetical protein